MYIAYSTHQKMEFEKSQPFSDMELRKHDITIANYFLIHFLINISSILWEIQGIKILKFSLTIWVHSQLKPLFDIF